MIVCRMFTYMKCFPRCAARFAEDSTYKVINAIIAANIERGDLLLITDKVKISSKVHSTLPLDKE